MPRIDEVGTVPRKDLHIFYVLDTSGSMADEGKIGMNKLLKLLDPSMNPTITIEPA